MDPGRIQGVLSEKVLSDLDPGGAVRIQGVLSDWKVLSDWIQGVLSWIQGVLSDSVNLLSNIVFWIQVWIQVLLLRGFLKRLKKHIHI